MRTPLTPRQVADALAAGDGNALAAAVAVAVLLPVCAWVYKDAGLRYNGRGAPLAWAVLVFSALVVFLPLYLLTRPPRRQPGDRQGADR